ncbi:MAG: hypothetical protein ACTSQJ_14545 [Promethearchaeota archaeon]
MTPYVYMYPYTYLYLLLNGKIFNIDSDCERWELYGDKCKTSTHECVDCLTDYLPSS